MGLRFDGRVAVVTGAASGIGLASTEAMLAAGSRVVMVDRDEAALKALCNKHGDVVIRWSSTCSTRRTALRCCRESWRRQASSTSCMQMRVRTSAATWSMPTLGLSTGC